jgi:hypothetical protein
MKTQKLSYVDAHALVKQKRPKIRPNDGFAEQLKQLEQELWQM